MKNIVILAAGPPKPNRERHTEINKNNNKIIIDNIIEKCIIDNTKLYIVINSKNIILLNHIKSKHDNVNILIPDNETIYGTFKTALSVTGDCILVCGDLINLRDNDIVKFVNTNFSSAICQYKIPWGNSLRGKNFIKRSDIGECITLISQHHKELFLSQENVENAAKYFKDFYPNKSINFNIYNDIGTFMNYAFFFKIVSNININSTGNIGTVLHDHKIYEDND